MNEDELDKPALRILPGEDELERLEISPSPRVVKPVRPVQSAQPVNVDDLAEGESVGADEIVEEIVEVLQPDHEAKLAAKTFEPDVAEILTHEEVEDDSEDGWGAAIKKAPPLGWLMLAGLLICGLGIWSAVSVFNAKPKLVDVQEEKLELVVDQIKETKEVRQTLGNMEDCVRGYLTAKTIEEKLTYVRHPDRVKPLMEHYYQSHEIVPQDFRQFERIRPLGLESVAFVFSLVELGNGETYKLLLEQLGDGSFRVDWESDVCYLPLAWDEFVTGAVKKPLVMRLYIRRDNFFAYEFSDDAALDCYQLTTRDSDNHVFGFVKKGTEVAMELNHFLQRSRGKGPDHVEPAILEVRFPEDSHSKKCVWIERLVTPRWTYATSPDSVEK